MKPKPKTVTVTLTLPQADALYYAAGNILYACERKEILDFYNGSKKEMTDGLAAYAALSRALAEAKHPHPNYNPKPKPESE